MMGFKNIKKIFKNQKGVALLMVMSVISILTFVLADFTYETKLNKLKVYNQQDKLKARLLAEAGLNFTMAKFKLYKATRNLLEEKQQLAEKFPKSMLEGIVTQPFIYPPPIPKSTGKIQRDILEEFTKNTVLEGKLTVFVTSVKGFLNPNNLRVKKQTENETGLGNELTDEQRQAELEAEKEAEKEAQQGEEGKGEAVKPHAYIEKQLIQTLSQAMEEKKEEDDIFDNLYGNLQPDILIKELKYFVTAKNSYEGAERGQFDSMYEGQDIAPKHSPLTSISELYLLQGWNDAIIDLMKDKMTVHEVSVIPINDINKSQLKALFPKINKEQVESFFIYRDGTTAQAEGDESSEPHPFKAEKDFKELMVTKLDVLSSEEYDKLSKEFSSAGLRFGVAGKLYKVTSKGEFGRASYTLEAYIDLPLKPQKIKKKKPKKNTPPLSEAEKLKREEAAKKEEEKNKKKKPKQLLLEPRVIEIKII